MQPVMRITILLMLMYLQPAYSLVCGQDLNGDGYVDTRNETAICETTPQGNYCPVGSAACVQKQTCPIDPSLACISGTCKQTGTCTLAPPVTPMILPAGFYDGTTSRTIATIRANGNALEIVYSDGTVASIILPGISLSGTVQELYAAIPGTLKSFGLTEWKANGSTLEIYQTLMTGSCPPGTVFVSSAFGSTICRGLAGTITTSAALVTVNSSGVAGSLVATPTMDIVAQPGKVVQYSPDGCLVSQSCTASEELRISNTAYICSLDRKSYLTSSACSRQCVKTATCSTSQPTCPTDPKLTCMLTSSGQYRCSPNQCVDINPQTVQNTTVSSSMPNNTGPRAPNGTCLGRISLFAGRAMTCGKVGIKTGFTDCCDKGTNGVFADSVGATVTGKVLRAGFSATAQFAALATTNFTYNVMSGMTAVDAATKATSYALNHASFLALNPTTLVVTAAVWAVQYLLLDNCSQQDMETAALKASKMCHFVGKYCSTKWPLIGCVQRRETHCCFNSMLARILHEQGRPQLSTFNGWGTPTNPDCRGFTPEEFQSLDFSSMDLSEYFGYIQSVAQQTINSGTPQADLNNAVSNFYNAIR